MKSLPLLFRRPRLAALDAGRVAGREHHIVITYFQYIVIAFAETRKDNKW
jgi:hypothetical protein